MSLKDKIMQQALAGYQKLGSAVYASEALPLFLIQRVIKGSSYNRPPEGYLQQALEEVERLLEEDTRRILEGHYPAQVLGLPAPRKHLNRLLKIYVDSLGVSWRRRRKETKSFGQEAQQYLDELPEYFKRNFHFQTDGYLSSHSAELYDHQVNILFRGTADPMRRMILWGLRDHAGFKGHGKGLKVLELACGTGSATRFLAKALPEASITSLDLSHPYLKSAKVRLRDFPRVQLMQGNASNTDFKDNTFDAVVSVFLFHELPYEERAAVLRESLRVLKPGGYMGMVDSLQLNDNPALNSGLENFPKDFHEPFYKNYIQKDMAGIFTACGAQNVQTSQGFLSKLVSSQKSQAQPSTSSSTPASAS